MSRARILLIYTGGTIGMKNDAATGALVPFDFNDIYDEFPSLGMINADIRILALKSIDSSNVTPGLWTTLAEIIKDSYDETDGFVILHGTDTMSYTASALSFMLEGLSKPVVFTGSQIPIGVLRTDGRENLITAIELAAAMHMDGTSVVPEVSLCFQNRLFRANRTTKFSSGHLSAFLSGNYPQLAEVGVNIEYNYPYIANFYSQARFDIFTGLDTAVNVVKIFPGINEKIFRAMTGIDGLRAIILETYGAGNAPTAGWFLDTVRERVESGVVVVNVTQCVEGKVSMDKYETGIGLRDTGVISGHDITTEACLAKLMYLLGKYPDDTAAVSERMKIPLRGEISL